MTQGIRDAAADAETLFNIAHDAYEREPRRAFRVWRALIKADVHFDFYPDAEWRVEECARAAFRAVLGLRG